MENVSFPKKYSSKNLRCKTLLVADYDYAEEIFCKPMLGIKLCLK